VAFNGRKDINKQAISKIIRLSENKVTYEEAEQLHTFLMQLAEICYNHLASKKNKKPEL